VIHARLSVLRRIDRHALAELHEIILLQAEVLPADECIINRVGVSRDE